MIYVVVLAVCLLYGAISLLAPSFVNGGYGYTVGNRLRLTAVLKFELEMLPFSVFAYRKIIAYFLPAYQHNEKTYRDLASRTSISSNKLFRHLFPITVVLWLMLVHMAHLLFYFPRPIADSFAYVSNMSIGLWTYFVPILFGFSCCSFLFSAFNIFSVTKGIYHLVLSVPLFKSILTDERFQFKLVGVISLLLSAATHISSKHLFVKEIEFTIKDLPQEAENLRFAMVSDLHAGACVGREQIAKVVETVNNLNVDGVFLVGDAVDGRRDEVFDRLGPLQFLTSKYGTYYVSGNHEYYYGDAMEWFVQLSDYGINVLNNRHVNISGICVAGVNDYSSGRSGIQGHKFDPAKALEGCDSSKPVIVLSHNPASAREVVANTRDIRVDLILSGHTHAGQFYTMAPIVYWILPYFHGVYEIAGKTKLFVSAGTLYQGAPMKMLGLTEIWIVTLKSSG